MMPRLLSAALVMSLASGFVIGLGGTGVADPQGQVSDSTVSGFPTDPRPAAGNFDWAQRARDFDTFAYNWTDRGAFTTIMADESALNMPAGSLTYRMPAYYGDTRVQGTSGDGNQEAVTQIASVVGATLVGVDKSDQDGHNYVDMLRTFYHSDLGVAKDTPSSSASAPGSSSMWYTTVSNVLYYMLGDQYPNATDMTAMLRSIADQYYSMLDRLGGANADLTMQDYDFATHTILKGRNEGGEAAAGGAAILLWAHAKFGDAKYLEGAKWAMDALQRSNQNLYYEVIPILAPYIAARMNAEDGTDYDVSKYIGWLTKGSSVRGGWGTLTSTWGGIDVSGLSGSLTDGGPLGATNGSTGYAFAMNSFATPLLAATAKYDSRFADLVGRWMLNVNHAARYFYPDQLAADQQYYGSRFINDPAHVVAYEGLTSSGAAGVMAMGDIPLRSGSWGVGQDATSLGLYGSSWVGFMGAALSDTNVKDVVRTDLNALDFFGKNDYPTALYYNPDATDARVTVSLSAGSRDLYDSVSDSMVATGVSGTTTVTVPAGHSLVLVDVPAGASRGTRGSATTFDGKAVAWNRNVDRDLAPDAATSSSSTLTGSSSNLLVDGDESTSWVSALGGTQSVQLDFGASRSFAHVSIVWGTSAARTFAVETSADGMTWNVQKEVADGSGGRTTISFPMVDARFVRVTMTEPVVPGSDHYSIRTLSASGPWSADDLALNRPTTASSVQNSINKVEYATDGNPSTRWESSTSDPQWLQVDLGTRRQLGRVQIAWETAAAKDYTIEVSDDGTTWSTAATVHNTSSPVTTETDLPAGTTGRFVRMFGTSRLTKYAYSLYSFSVFAPAESSTTNPDGSVASRPASILDATDSTTGDAVTEGAQTTLRARSLTPGASVDVTWTSTGNSSSVGPAVVQWEGKADSAGALVAKGVAPHSGVWDVRVTDAYGVSASLEGVRSGSPSTEPTPTSGPTQPGTSGPTTGPTGSPAPSLSPGSGTSSHGSLTSGSGRESESLATTGATSTRIALLVLVIAAAGSAMLIASRQRL